MFYYFLDRILPFGIVLHLFKNNIQIIEKYILINKVDGDKRYNNKNA